MRARSSFFMVLVIVAMSITTLQGANAAGALTSPRVLLVASSTSPAAGSEVDFQVQVDTGGRSVNAVQADFTYPTRLTFLGFDDTGSAFSINAQETASGGIVRIAKGRTGTVSGTVLVTTVRFAAGSAGTASVCPADTSAIVEPPTGTATPLSGSTTALHIGGASSFDLSCAHKDYVAPGASNWTVNVYGHGFTAASSAVLTASGSGVTFATIAVVSSTKMTAAVSVASSATAGYRDISISNGTKSFLCRSCFKVGTPPIVQSAAPSSIARGSMNVTLAVSGLNFGPATVATIARANVVSQTWISYNRIDVVVNVPSAATTGGASIKLSDPYNLSFGYYGVGRCAHCIAIT